MTDDRERKPDPGSQKNRPEPSRGPSTSSPRDRDPEEEGSAGRTER